MFICKCISCDLLLEDNNPSETSKNFPELDDTDKVTDGTIYTDGAWVCPRCLDEDYIVDIDGLYEERGSIAYWEGKRKKITSKKEGEYIDTIIVLLRNIRKREGSCDKCISILCGVNDDISDDEIAQAVGCIEEMSHEMMSVNM